MTTQPPAGCEVDRRATATRVLVVDDHVDTANAVSQLLRLWGYAATPATSYRGALDAARATRFDVLLCDIALSDGDGCALLAELRAMYRVRAIAFSGYGMPADVQRCRDAGYDHFFLKPIEPDELRAVLAQTRPDHASAGSEATRAGVAVRSGAGQLSN